MSGWFCQECGHAFKTVKAAERASFGDRGCPKCGGADIDLGSPKARHSGKYAHDCVACIAGTGSADETIDAHVRAIKAGGVSAHMAALAEGFEASIDKGGAS